jgi:hypothetical protein
MCSLQRSDRRDGNRERRSGSKNRPMPSVGANSTPTFSPEFKNFVARHLAAENAHQMEETLAALHPDCLFEDLPFGKTYRGRASQPCAINLARAAVLSHPFTR